MNMKTSQGYSFFTGSGHFDPTQQLVFFNVQNIIKNDIKNDNNSSDAVETIFKEIVNLFKNMSTKTLKSIKSFMRILFYLFLFVGFVYVVLILDETTGLFKQNTHGHNSFIADRDHPPEKTPSAYYNTDVSKSEFINSFERVRHSININGSIAYDTSNSRLPAYDLLVLLIGMHVKIKKSSNKRNDIIRALKLLQKKWHYKKLFGKLESSMLQKMYDFGIKYYKEKSIHNTSKITTPKWSGNY